jgi:hypothetical protein
LEELKNSGIQFTAVCSPPIENGNDDEDAVTAVEEVKEEVKFIVKGGNLGNLVLSEAKNPSHLHKSVGIWNK